MPDYNGLLKVIKQAGVEAGAASGPVNVCFGKVMSASPLKVLVEQKMTLGAAQLILTRNVTDYEIDVTDEGTGNALESSEERRKVTVYNSLAAGDEVVLLRQQGGQKYIIIDKVG